MPSLNNSPPPDASSTVRGLVNLAAQTFEGVKTFSQRIVAVLGITAGAAQLELSSALGGGASDIATKIGSTVADASVSATAKLLSLRTGIGGTEVEKVFFSKTGALVGDAGLTSSLGTSIFAIREVDIRISRTSSVLSLNEAGGGSAQLYNSSGSRGIEISSTFSNHYGPATLSTAVIQTIAALTLDASVHAAAKLVSYKTGLSGTPVEKACVTITGRFDQQGTDSSGTPGAATINKPTGISAIANGASSVVITNNLVTAASRVLITWHADHGASRQWVTRAAGSFTVNLSSAASANAAFSWQLAEIL